MEESMSVVIAVKDKDKFIVACDDRENTGNLYFDSYDRKSKARGFKGKNNFIIGCTGNLGIMDIYSKMVGKLETINKDTLLNSIIEFQKEYRNTPYIDDNNYLNGAMIVACNDKAYCIGSNLCIVEIIDYEAI